MSEQTPKRSNLEPHPFQEHPLYPDYCAFAIGDEDYCKREQNNEIHLSDDIDQHGRRIPFDSPEAQPQGVELLACPLVHPIRNGVRFMGFSKGPTNKSDRYHIWCYDCGLAFEGQPSETAESVARRWNTRADLPRATADNDDDAAILDDERVDKELRRWQDAIRDKMIGMGVPDHVIDGAGCDSGDPLDFTLAEVGQGVGYFVDQLESAPRATGETGLTVEGCLTELREIDAPALSVDEAAALFDAATNA
jgi:hypothetical protein